jgi:hypothetical protein
MIAMAELLFCLEKSMSRMDFNIYENSIDTPLNRQYGK